MRRDGTAVLKVHVDVDARVSCVDSGLDFLRVIVSSGAASVEISRRCADVSVHDVDFARDLVSASQQFLVKTQLRLLAGEQASGSLGAGESEE